MEKLEATFRIVTPMFIGGANQTPDDGIRPPSVKGVLRFWWRALNWGRFYKEAKQDETEALKALHKEEAWLFGLAAKTENGKQVGGQGCFLLSILHNELRAVEKNTVHNNFKPTRKRRNKNGRSETDENHLAAARYLGYGLMTAFTSRCQTGEIKRKAGQLERSCLDENQVFTVSLAFRGQVDPSVLNALKALGLLGGLGSRSRHGMGSIALEKIAHDEKDKWIAPTTQEAYQTEVKKLFGDFSCVSQPDYSAFSKESRVDYLLSSNSPYKVLDEFGLRMLDYRSWGKTKNYSSISNILPSGKKSEKNFSDDHDWHKNKYVPGTKKTWREDHPGFHPERIIFGLPHNYGKYDNQKVNGQTYERRASPLFFHVHRLNEREYIGVSVLLKSRFLPEVEKINAGDKPVDQNIKWKVITDFLDSNVGNPPSAERRFPDRKPVLP